MHLCSASHLTTLVCMALSIFTSIIHGVAASLSWHCSCPVAETPGRVQHNANEPNHTWERAPTVHCLVGAGAWRACWRRSAT